jgi:hypothetical protein
VEADWPGNQAERWPAAAGAGAVSSFAFQTVQRVDVVVGGALYEKSPGMMRAFAVLLAAVHSAQRAQPLVPQYGGFMAQTSKKS